MDERREEADALHAKVGRLNRQLRSCAHSVRDSVLKVLSGPEGPQQIVVTLGAAGELTEAYAIR